MTASKTIRLMLVDDHPIMRAGLSNMLNLEPGFAVVAQADDGETAVKLYRQHRPDIVLLDVSLVGIDGIETLRRLREEWPQARVLMLTASEAREDVRLALDTGAAGYVTKSVRHAELVAAIRQIHAGGKAIGETVARQFAAEESCGLLSRREVEVLHLVRKGFTNAEIGKLLGISERTARAHIAALMEKLDASDRAAAVARGFERGVLKA
ncbi:MAG: response regulator transcription factor [bacterium]